MNIFSTILADLEKEWAKIFGTSGATISATVVTDLQLIGSGLQSALTTFGTLTGINSGTLEEIEKDVSSISAAALSVATTVETNIAKPIAQQIATDFAALQGAIGNIALPSILEDILKAVATLLPYVEAGVGILTAATVGAAEATGLTADEARLILKGN
jgi:hypothetical protein